MAVNASARQYRVWVCKPGQPESSALDVTRYCSGDTSGFFVATSTPVSENGLFLVSGQLSLEVPPNDLTFDPWESPGAEWWTIGNYIRVQVADELGILRELPLNRLFIISEPKPPYPGNWKLEVELGCALTLKDGVKATQTSNSGDRNSHLSDLLGQCGLNLADNVEGDGSGTYQPSQDPVVAQAGKLAFAGLCGLYQRADQGIGVASFVFTPEYRLFKHVVGVDDVGDYEPLQNPRRPASDVEVVTTDSAFQQGQTAPQNEFKYRGSSTSIEPMSQATISDDGSANEVVGIIRRDSWQWSGSIYTQMVEEQRARGLVIPVDLYEYLLKQGRDIVVPSPYMLLYAFVHTETRTYEGSDEGRLLKVRKETTKTKGEVLAEWYKKNLLPNASVPAFSDMIFAEVEETTYSYKRFDGGANDGQDAKGQVRQIKTVKWLPKGQVAAGANDWIDTGGILGPTTKPGETDLVVAAVRIESWQKRSTDDWVYKLQVYEAGKARSGTIRGFLRLCKMPGSKTVTSRNGEIRPPAAERRPATEGGERTPPTFVLWKGKVKFKTGSGLASDRVRTIEVNQVDKPSDVDWIAEVLGKFDHYRHRGFRLTTALRDEWFFWKPFSRIDLQYRGYVYTGITDSVTFTLAADQAIVVADCMRTGRMPASDNYPAENALSVPISPEEGDPSPLEPGAETSLPIIPAVQVIYTIKPTSKARVLFTYLPHATGPQPSSNFTIQGRSRLMIAQKLEVRSRGRVIITQDPRLTVRGRSRVLFSTPPDNAGLFAYWKLDTTAWTDTVGGYNLSYEPTSPFDQNPAIVTVVNDGGVNVAEFKGAYGLVRSGAALSTVTATQRWSWKLTFDLKLINNPDGDFYPGNLFWLEDEFTSAIVDEYNGTLDAYEYFVRLDVPLSGEQTSVTHPTKLNKAQWYAIELEYNASTHIRTVRVDGIAASNSVSAANRPSSITSGNFLVGSSGPQNCRMKEVKFYKLALVNR